MCVPQTRAFYRHIAAVVDEIGVGVTKPECLTSAEVIKYYDNVGAMLRGTFVGQPRGECASRVCWFENCVFN